MRIDVKTEPLTDDLRYLTKSFKSGNVFLDEFLRSDDALNSSIGKTFIWVNERLTIKSQA
jgi:hypothetical protein